MVNKGSFFQRLKERWGSSSGVRVDRKNGGKVERVSSRQVAAGAPAERRSTRKMSEREEALVALSSHFEELTSLLRGSHTKVDAQLGKLVTATDKLTALPTLGEQQLEALRALSVHMEKQSAVGEQMAATVTRLPSMLENGAPARRRHRRAHGRDGQGVPLDDGSHPLVDEHHGRERQQAGRGDAEAGRSPR